MPRRRIMISAGVAIVLVATVAAVGVWGDSERGSTRVKRAVPSATPGVRLATSTWIPDGVDTKHRAPAVLVAHGLGDDQDDVSGLTRALVREGYVVQTWNSRGGKSSGGRVGISPDWSTRHRKRPQKRLARHGARHVDKALHGLSPAVAGNVVDEAAASKLLSRSLVRQPVHHATRADAIAPIVREGFRIPAGAPSSTGAGVYTSVSPDAAWGEVMLRVAIPTERPFHVRSTDELFDGIRSLGRADLLPAGEARSFDGPASQDLRAALRERGYDSIVRDHDDGARWVIGLDPDAVRVVR